MTVASREIEVKYRVPNPTELVAGLAARGIELGPAVEQDDQAYAPVGWRYGDSKLGVPFVRLRSQGGRHLFTLKRPVENELSCIEYESEVADRDQMHNAILAMGFYPTVRIHKARRVGRYCGWLLCLDHVTTLGWFVEVEVIDRSRDADGLAEQLAMQQFVEQLGVPAHRTAATYDSLLFDVGQAS